MLARPTRHAPAVDSFPRPRVSTAAGVLLITMVLAAPAIATGKSGKEGRPESAKPVSPAVAPAAPAVASAGVPGTAGAQPSFSVEMVMKQDGETYTVRRTVDGPRSRMDITTAETQMAQITLGDEAGTSYTLMPGEKRAIKQSTTAMMARMPMTEAKAQPDSATEEPADLELLGKETVNGRAAEKYRVQMGEGTGLMWIDAENNLPLRMEAEGTVVDFKNYVFGAQKPELFEVPKGYDVMDMDAMMAKLPKGALGGMPAPGGMPGMGAMAGGMAGGMARGMAGSMGGSLGGTFGGALGGSLGGPIGSMIGQYVGQKIGAKIGSGAAGAVLPGK